MPPVTEHAAPVRVHPPPRAAAGPKVDLPPPARARVHAVIPCHDRPADLERLLADLAAIDRAGAALAVTVVDNASSNPLPRDGPPGLALRLVRLERNTGGSGGFNAGMRTALDRAGDDRPDFLWLLDSDARLAHGALRELLRAFDDHPRLVVAGSALADPDSGRIHEIGGRVDRLTGSFMPAARGRAGAPSIVEADYVAACSALVRADAVRATGLLPDVFLNADDVEWCVRLRSTTGGIVAGVPASVAFHPRFDRFATWARYYVARNALGPLDALALPRGVRLVRALRETARAVQQALVGREDLAELHVRGLRDALRGPRTGPAPLGTVRIEPAHPLASLASELRPLLGPRLAGRTCRISPELPLSPRARAELEAQLRLLTLREPTRRGRDRSLLARLLGADPVDVAIVPARARPDAWFRGRISVQVAGDSFVARRTRRSRALAAAGVVGVRALALAVALARRGPVPVPLPPAPQGAAPASAAPVTPRPSLTIAVVSYNRWPALAGTLHRLAEGACTRGTPVIVVDNASTDGSPERARREHPRVRVERLAENAGVDAFNRAVALADTELVLVLDDDAWPDQVALGEALDLLAGRPDLAAVALHPRHPASSTSEWRFGEALPPTDAWPFMGCGNLVRRTAWLEAGGYEPAYFLYRNDTDLALKLLGAGKGVHFNPAWVVWHDSRAAGRKSTRWFRLATRNWIWTARRHGTGAARTAGALFGWAWAHRLAGVSLRGHAAAIRGALEGWLADPPPTPAGARPPGEAWRRLLQIRLGRRSTRVPAG